MTLKSTENLSLGGYLSAFDSALEELSSREFLKNLHEKNSILWKDTPEHRRIIENSLGWLDLPQSMSEKAAELIEFSKEIHGSGFTRVVLLGMGGSSLAPLVFSEVFHQPLVQLELIVLDSTDPSAISSVLDSVDLLKTLFIVASKSGSTIEPLSLSDFFFDKLSKLTDKPGDNFIAITDEGSYLQNLAREQSFRQVFVNPSDIGGRYSALSYFGLVPAALIGVDIVGLLNSANSMALECSHESDEWESQGARLGAALGALALKGRDKLTFLLPKKLSYFGLWLEQLIAESTGKDGKGIIPISGEAQALGKDYSEDRVFVIIVVKGDKSFVNTIKDLRGVNYPVIEIEIEDIYELGAQIYLWEVATAAAGVVIDINPFDQPDVEEAKKLTKAILKELPNKTESAELTLPQSLTNSFDFLMMSGGEDSADIYSKIENFIESRIKEGGYLSLLSYTSPLIDTATDARFTSIQDIRTKLMERFKVPTQFGFGPRYLHSTGQLHKGGPSKGIFIVFATPPTGSSEDLILPNGEFTFGQLIFSQAIGDAEALITKGRSLIFINLSKVSL
ncbi:MAG: hypothetical protein KAT46_01740 [Deltaproteobacteria bacterium]|nr:hypothetical protein [Deltaproteobacteria bacterium]